MPSYLHLKLNLLENGLRNLPVKMKISIIVPTENQETYLLSLINYIRLHTNDEQLEEIILVNSFEDAGLEKIAEKSHAKLYIFKSAKRGKRSEVGAFEAKGEILYFIKPGHFPPPDFAKRIIKASEKKLCLGTVKSSLLYFLCKSMRWDTLDRLVVATLPLNNVFISRKLYFRLGGLQFDGKLRSFRELFKQSTTLGQIIY